MKIRTVAIYCKQIRLLLAVINSPKSNSFQVIEAQDRMLCLHKEQALVALIKQLLEEFATAQEEFLKVACPQRPCQSKAAEVPHQAADDFWAGLD